MLLKPRLLLERAWLAPPLAAPRKAPAEACDGEPLQLPHLLPPPARSALFTAWLGLVVFGRVFWRVLTAEPDGVRMPAALPRGVVTAPAAPLSVFTRAADPYGVATAPALPYGVRIPAAAP